MKEKIAKRRLRRFLSDFTKYYERAKSLNLDKKEFFGEFFSEKQFIVDDGEDLSETENFIHQYLISNNFSDDSVENVFAYAMCNIADHILEEEIYRINRLDFEYHNIDKLIYDTAIKYSELLRRCESITKDEELLTDSYRNIKDRISSLLN